MSEDKSEQQMELGEDSKYEHFYLVLQDYGEQASEPEVSSKPRKKRKHSNSNILCIQKDQVIKLLHKDDSGWWWGQKYNKESKVLEGTAGYFPSNYVKHYFSSFKPQEDPKLQHMHQYPSDWLNYCYTHQVKPKQALAATSEHTHFKGLPLLENAKDDQDPASKAYRVLNQFFDYEKWNEHMNKIDPSRRKGKPNPKLKKPKKVKW